MRTINRTAFVSSRAWTTLMVSVICILTALIASRALSDQQPEGEVAIHTEVGDFFYPSGWMGDGELADADKYVEFDDAAEANCRTPPTCIRIGWTPGPRGWAGIYWQHPDGNWGEEAGCDLTGADAVTFWARGESGEETVQFEAALAGSGSKVVGGSKKLSRSWQQYEISLQGESSLKDIVGAFAWLVRRGQNPRGAAFYLDDLRIEGLSPRQIGCP